jgi:hypothetical protein
VDAECAEGPSCFMSEYSNKFMQSLTGEAIFLNISPRCWQLKISGLEMMLRLEIMSAPRILPLALRAISQQQDAFIADFRRTVYSKSIILLESTHHAF